MDVLFVDLPADFNIPTPAWCLGYRFMIATLRQEGFSAAILHPVPEEFHNARTRLIQDLLLSNPKIVGFTTYDLYLPQLFQFIRDARKCGLKSHITLGGLCASAIPEKILASLPDVDSVICGEGELSIVDLAKTVIHGESVVPAGTYIRQGNKILFGGSRPLIENLDELPSPVMDNFTHDGSNAFAGGSALVIASRGCYGRCVFCCLQRFYRSCSGKIWRGRSPQKVLQEISDGVQAFKAQRITFVDENFLGPGQLGRQHALDVITAIQRSQIDIPFNFGCRPNDLHRETLEEMKKAGLAAVTLGIESMSPETLKLFNKDTTPEINEAAVKLLEDLKLYLEITFIFFHPLTSFTEIRQNLQFVERIRQSRFAYFNKNMPFTEFIPFFQTEYTQKLVEMKLVKRTLKGYTLRYQDPGVGTIARKTKSVPLEQLSRLTHELQTDDPKLQDTLQSLREYDYYLNMVRLPELISDYCDFFAAGGPPAAKRARLIEMEFDRETQKIQSLYSLITQTGGLK